MTPAEELFAAAARLREKAAPLLAANAHKDWDWRDFFTLHGADLNLLREDEEWIALMSPLIAEPLAWAMEDTARTIAMLGPPPDDSPAGKLLAIARLINQAGGQ